MKKLLFAGFGFLFCGVALFSVSKALTIEINPCFRSNSEIGCRSYNQNRFSGCRLSRCNYQSYNQRTNYKATIVRYKTTTKTTTPVYRNSYARNYRTTYTRPTTYKTYTRSTYVKPTVVVKPIIKTSYRNGCVNSTCNNRVQQTAYTNSYVRPTVSQTRYTGCARSTCTTNTQSINSYEATYNAQINSIYEGGNTYLISPNVDTYGATWSWNYNSKSVTCDIVNGNNLRCEKLNNEIQTEITANFYVNGKAYTSNIINL